jgi:hypothetical protein
MMFVNSTTRLKVGFVCKGGLAKRMSAPKHEMPPTVHQRLAKIVNLCYTLFILPPKQDFMGTNVGRCLYECLTPHVI